MSRFVARRRRQGGQVVPLFLLGLISFVLLIVMILNTGQEVVRRTEVQNAADAAAITQASWTARTLNLMTMNQVALTQSFSTSVAAAVYAQTLAEAQLETIFVLAELIKPCVTIIGCIPFAQVTTTVQIPLGAMQLRFPGQRARDFKDLAIAMHDMNGHLVEDFPRFTERIASDVAGPNRVDAPLFHPADDATRGRATPLPVEKTAALGLELPPHGPFPLCRAAEDGTSLGVRKNYDERVRGYAPYQAALTDLGNHFGLNFALTALSPHRAFMRIYGNEYGLPQVHVQGNNAATRELEDVWPLYCGLQAPPVVVPSALVIFPFFPAVDLYKVNERPILPLPSFLTPQDTRDAMSLVAFARRRSSAAILPEQFGKTESATYAYAQAEVFSDGGSYDLYTQDWRARLIPAGLVEREQSEVEDAVSEWPELREFIRAVAANEWEQVNVH